MSVFLKYRDTLKPDPIWEEVGVYGGYRWIESPISPYIWISRRWESQVLLLDKVLSGETHGACVSCDLSCVKEFKDMLADNGIILEHMPSYKQISADMTFSQALKVIKTVKYAKDVLVVDPNKTDTKLAYAFVSQPEVYAIGYSPLLDSLIQQGKVSRVVSDKYYYDCDMQIMSPEALAQATASHVVFIDSMRMEVKSDICNWANVINF